MFSQTFTLQTHPISILPPIFGPNEGGAQRLQEQPRDMPGPGDREATDLAISRLRFSSNPAPRQREDMAIARKAVPITLSDIFLPSLRIPVEAIERIKKREWRVCSEEEVERKLSKPIPFTAISNPTIRLGDCSFLETHCREIFRPSRENPDGHRRIFFTSESRSDGPLEGRLDRLLKGSIPMKRELGGQEQLQYSAILEAINGDSCADFVQEHIQQIFSESFQSLPHPVESHFSERAREPSSRLAYIWNSLKLSIVKLQEAWNQWAKRIEHVEGFRSFSSASLCAIFFTSSEIWSLSIGNAKAILLNEEAQTIRYLAPHMSFSNNTLAQSIEKRGGIVTCAKKRFCQGERISWIPQLAGKLLIPRVIGARNVPGVAARPKITRWIHRKEEPFTLILAPESLWKTFSGPDLLNLFSQLPREGNIHRIFKTICSDICSKVVSAKSGATCSFFVWRYF